MILFRHAPVMAQTGFVHLQSENGQPFYVQWNGYTYSSSGSGYMVIPKMSLGEQTMVVGFAKNQYPEYIFKYTLTDKPRGFSLKLNTDNSWSLFDMVSFVTIKGKPVAAGDKAAIQKEIERIARENRVEDPQENVFKVIDVKNTSGIFKIFDRTTDEGTDLVYVVTNDGITDTVVIFIPSTPVLANGIKRLPLQRHPHPEKRLLPHDLLITMNHRRQSTSIC